VVVSGGADRTVRVRDAVSGQSVGQLLTGHVSWVRAVAVGRTEDRDVIVSGSEDGMIRVWDAVTGQPVGSPLTGHVGRVTAVAVNRAMIVSGGEDGMVRTWDMETRQPVAWQRFPDGLWSPALTGERLVVAQGNDVVALRADRAIMQVTGFPVGQERVP
jgi:WD40 repeat protein